MEGPKIKKILQQEYGRIAQIGVSCCGPNSQCRGSQAGVFPMVMGYGEADLVSVPEGANLGLGCGNPVAIAGIKEGETVLDLGSGAGFDCFLASKKVGKQGRVIGLDMTTEMVERATKNAKEGGYENVHFILGDMEDMPICDQSVDLVISNCVVNLSPDKKKVFQEVYRVLKPGGRLMISDIVLLQELPLDIKESSLAYVGCVSGAVLKAEYLGLIEKAGFEAVKILSETPYALEFLEQDPLLSKVMADLKSSLASEGFGLVASISVAGEKPRHGRKG